MTFNRDITCVKGHNLAKYVYNCILYLRAYIIYGIWYTPYGTVKQQLLQDISPFLEPAANKWQCMQWVRIDFTLRGFGLGGEVNFCWLGVATPTPQEMLIITCTIPNKYLGANTFQSLTLRKVIHKQPKLKMTFNRYITCLKGNSLAKHVYYCMPYRRVYIIYGI